MAFRSRLPEQIERDGRRGRTAAAVQRHLRERDLSVGQADVGRPREPGARLLEIASHTEAFEQHSSKHVLRLGHALGRPTQPGGRQLLIALDANSFDETKAQIEGGDEIAGRRCLFEPRRNLCRVLGAARSLHDEVGKVHARGLIARFGGEAHPARCFRLVLGDAGSGYIQ